MPESFDSVGVERAVLQAYFLAFNRSDVRGVIARLHPDVQFDRGSWPKLIGREAFAEFYERLWAKAKEDLRVTSLERRGAGWHAHLEVDLLVAQPIPDFPGGPLSAGTAIKGARNCLLYELDRGLIRKIVDRTEDHIVSACRSWLVGERRYGC